MSKIYNLNADTKVIAKSVVSKRIFDCENAHVDVFAFNDAKCKIWLARDKSIGKRRQINTAQLL